MKNNYTLYDVTISTMTPLHIGSGNLLLNHYDYAVHNGSTWRINDDALLDAQDGVEDVKMAEQLARTAPAELLNPEDYNPDSPFIRYRLKGKPRSKDRGSQLKEQIKTGRDEAYLPGSSLKGAIRTALAWHGWKENGLKPDKNELERNRKYAGRRIEQEIMGSDPNHDLLRALQVSDSLMIGNDCLLALNVQVVTRGSVGSPVELEAVQPDTEFKLTIKVDDALFSQWARDNGLQFGGNSAWLKQLPKLIQNHTEQRLKDELEWYKSVPNCKEIAGFYRGLLKLPDSMCLLQVGWGTGWGDKTYGSHLQADDRFMEHIISAYRLDKGNRDPGDHFPKSRCTIVKVGKDKSGRPKTLPSLPLGWVLMEMKERER